MIEIKVDGNIYGGWLTARLPFGIEQIANSFELTLTDRWPKQDSPRPIKIGSACKVLIDNEVVITGWVDNSSPQFDENSHHISVAGRDVTGDLVDCSAIHKSGQWANSTIEKIARDICAPYGIKVLLDTVVGAAFPTFSIHEGESAHEAIDRACRMRAVMPVSDGQGNLVLTRAKDGPPVAELIQGVNIKSARAEFSMRERFSEYIIKGQGRGNDGDSDFPEMHTQISATSKDDFVKRYRPLIVLAEECGVHATYKERAEWERNVRRGRSARATILVNGWRNPSGALWRANTIVHLNSSHLGADADLLIVGGTYIMDAQMGQMTELNLVAREAFDLEIGIKTTKLSAAISGKNGAAKGTHDNSRKNRNNDWSNF